MTGTITPIGAFTAPSYSRDSVAGAALYDPIAAPGSANPPIIFEPPGPLTGETTEAWVVATGAGANWGGCSVWVSTDDTTYAQAGIIYRGARQGLLTAALASAADPDGGNTLSVDLTESGAQLLSATREDADGFVTLCYCDGELLSYQTATLTAAYKYDLTYLRRGVYGTDINWHSAGTKFARIGPNSASVLRYRYPPSFIGRTVWVKLQSFNLFSANAEALEDVAATRYTLTGAGLDGGTGYTPPSPPTFFPLPRRALLIAADADDDVRQPTRR